MSRSGVRGFTLVEALVAVTLLALLFGALMPVFQQGLSVLERGDRRTRAVLLAQSVLERYTVSMTEAQGALESEASGEEDGFAWQVTREPYAADDGGPAADLEAQGLALMLVRARVQWPPGDNGITLATLVLEPSP